MTQKRRIKLCKKHRSWRMNMIGQELQSSASELRVRLEEEILQKRKRPGRRAAVSIELRFRLHNRQFLRNLERSSSSPKALKSQLLRAPCFQDAKIFRKTSTRALDIGTAAASFGTIYGPPTSPRWIYRCDFNNDRKVDMKDIGGVPQNFGKTSAKWTPPP